MCQKWRHLSLGTRSGGHMEAMQNPPPSTYRITDTMRVRGVVSKKVAPKLVAQPNYKYATTIKALDRSVAGKRHNDEITSNESREGAGTKENELVLHYREEGIKIPMEK